MRTLATLLLLLPHLAHAETVRSMLAGDRPGSVQQPVELTDPKALEALCAEVSKRAPFDAEHPDADAKAEEWDRARKMTFAKVYRAAVDPKSVRFEPYDPAKRKLKIAVDRSLPALDGALLISVMDRERASFATSADEAKKWIERAEQKQLRLAITFQVDDQHAEELVPCFSYPKSEQYSLRVLPLRYELLEAEGKAIASTTTKRMEELGEWIAKGGPGVEISTQIVGGVLDQPALDQAIRAKESALGACVAKAGDTASFGFVAGVAAGKLSNLRVEMEASDDPAAADCLITALTGTPAPKASKDASVSLLVSTD